MTKALANQSSAMTLKDYLNSDQVRTALAAAVPKNLSVDRLLRVFFGAVNGNPKLLKCTTKSILQSAMVCAQLGLEPILGRMYLIPYNNSKKIDGKWVKELECQAQPGYQGLVELARRSGTIADVWGHCVYENDFFDMSYGMERGLVHRPWYMDAVKRRANDPGDIIGAYVVWQLKDGTKHPDFMPIHEINKRRDVSRPFQLAEFGDPQRGGGKKDSVWHLWPDEMRLKVVIKHSSKLVPASIEYMDAVAIDNEAEALAIEGGRRALLPHDTSPQPDQGGPVETFDTLALAAQFDILALARFGNLQDGLNSWLESAAINQDMTLEEAKAQAMQSNDIERCFRGFEDSRAAMEKIQNGLPKTDKTGETDNGEKQSGWNPLEASLQARYGNEKKNIMLDVAKDLGLVSPAFDEAMTGPEMHRALLEATGQIAPLTERDIAAPGAPPQDEQAPPLASTTTEEDGVRISNDTIAKFNSMWRTVASPVRDYACGQCACKRTINGFQRPTGEQFPAWIAAAEARIAEIAEIRERISMAEIGVENPDMDSGTKRGMVSRLIKDREMLQVMEFGKKTKA